MTAFKCTLYTGVLNPISTLRLARNLKRAAIRNGGAMRTLTTLFLISTACFAADTMGRLKTEVDPGRAGVFIDGKYVGPAGNFKVAQTYTLAPGEHEVKLVDPRYQDIVKQVTIEAGKKTILQEKMVALPIAKPPYGYLRVE